MAIKVIDLKRKVEDSIKTREVKHTPFLAVIVSVHGSIYAKNRPNFVWVSENAQPESRHVVYQGLINPYENLKVWVRKSPKPPHALEIIGLYVSAADPSVDISPFAMPPHAPNHQMPSESNLGIDPVKTYQPAIQILKTTGNGSDLTVYTYAYSYFKFGVKASFNGLYTDMTSYLPSTGMDVRVLIYLDTLTNTLQYLSSAEVVSGSGPPDFVDMPQNGIGSAYVFLSDGQTAITTADHLTDARDFMGGSGGSSTGADSIGQILYSTDGINFTPETPMVNADGIMLNPDGLIMVI